MRTFLVAALLLLVASLAFVPSASASGSCDGVVPGAVCVVETAREYCIDSPPNILSQCYGYTLTAAGGYAVGVAITACELVLGPGNCNPL